jgi:hypothetical protein
MQPISSNRILHNLFAIVALGLFAYGSLSVAQQAPYPYYPGYGYPYAPQRQQPQQPKAQTPQAPAQQQGYAPQQYPYQQWTQPAAPGYQQAAPQTRQKPPSVETELSSYTPYIQQNLVLTLRVISEGNLGALQVKLPALDGVAIKLLDGPIASSKAKSIVNQYHYSLTPLRSGTLIIPPLSVSGNFATASSQAFTIESGDPIRLEVKPANDAVRPWLPLNGLLLQAYLEDADKPEAGKPIGLVIDISAIGITGNQLPSIEPHLKSDAFRIYREETESKGRLSPDGKLLMGSRSERFTLVPQYGGKLQIPELSIPWWNVDSDRAEITTVPIKQIVTRGELGEDDNPITDLFPGASTILLWSPLVAAFAFTIGFWILAWLRKKRFVQVVEEEVAIVGTFAFSQFRDLMAWISPIRRLQKVRQIFVRNLPRSFRLWFCVKVVDGESDPEVWTYMLRFLANKHLGISPYLPLVALGEQLAAIHDSDQRQMAQLMHELDASVYGGKPVEFDDWKKRFRQQLKPRPLQANRLKRKHSVQKLPPLNPDTSHTG